MSTTASQTTLSSKWALPHNELVLGFETPQLASQYQKLVPEARIYKSNATECYLPRPDGLLGVRSSSRYGQLYSLGLDFESERELREWVGRVLVAFVFDQGPTSAYLLRVVDRKFFKDGGVSSTGSSKAATAAGGSAGEKAARVQPVDLYTRDPKDPNKFILINDPGREKRERRG